MNITEFRKVGETFMFMGVQCIVTHSVTEQHYPGVGTLPPYIVGTYVDRNGKFQKHEFKEEELPALLNENPDTHPTMYTHEEILEVLTEEYEQLLDKNAHVSFSMQGGYSDGVKDLFHRLHMRIIF